MKRICETGRLRLREFTVQDAPFIIDLLNSEKWLQFIGERNVKTEPQAKAYLENGPLTSYREHGFGLWAVELKPENTLIGMCGLLKRETLNHPDIGFALLPQYMGKGYGLEVARATMLVAKDTLKLPVVYAIVLPTNTTSINLLQKIGMTFQRNFQFPTKPEALLLYSNSPIAKDSPIFR